MSAAIRESCLCGVNGYAVWSTDSACVQCFSLFYYIPLAECGQIRASKSHSTGSAACSALSVINSESSQISRAGTIERFSLVVHALAVVLRDNSGTGILLFPPPLKPASARAAIPRTSNPLQDCNSWVHRNGSIAFPYILFSPTSPALSHRCRYLTFRSFRRQADATFGFVANSMFTRHGFCAL
jgi:hypothetical protein